MPKKEKWYDGDFKKKYPNGVLCWVWDSFLPKRKRVIIINYHSKQLYPFVPENGLVWEFAQPVTPDEAPAILKEEDWKDE